MLTPLLLIAVATLTFFKIGTEAYNPEKYLCDGKVMKSIEHLVENIPKHVRTEIENCIHETESGLVKEEQTIKCGTGNTNIPALHYNIIMFPSEFAQCGLNTVEEMQDKLSASEKKQLEKIEDDVVELIEKLSQ